MKYFLLIIVAALLFAMVRSAQTESGDTVDGGSRVTPKLCFFFVSPKGSDGNSGLSRFAPFATMSKAARAMRGVSAGSQKVTCIMAGILFPPSMLTLTAADNNETWQLDPESGYQSAIIDGSSGFVGCGCGLADIIVARGTDRVTFQGLKFQNFRLAGIHFQGGSKLGLANTTNPTIIDNEFGPNTSSTWNSGAWFLEGASVNFTIDNNYVHDMGSMGGIVNSWYSPSEPISGEIKGNVLLRTVLRVNDGGSIYVSMHGGYRSLPGAVRIQNNFVRDYGPPGVDDAAGIYLDDTANHVLVKGNVVGPPLGLRTFAFALNNNGDANLVTGNIFDLGTSNRVYTPYGSIKRTSPQTPG
jgi:hypothetical protein